MGERSACGGSSTYRYWFRERRLLDQRQFIRFFKGERLAIRGRDSGGDHRDPERAGGQFPRDGEWDGWQSGGNSVELFEGVFNA